MSSISLETLQDLMNKLFNRNSGKDMKFAESLSKLISSLQFLCALFAKVSSVHQDLQSFVKQLLNEQFKSDLGHEQQIVWVWIKKSLLDVAQHTIGNKQMANKYSEVSTSANQSLLESLLTCSQFAIFNHLSIIVETTTGEEVGNNIAEQLKYHKNLVEEKEQVEVSSTLRELGENLRRDISELGNVILSKMLSISQFAQPKGEVSIKSQPSSSPPCPFPKKRYLQSGYTAMFGKYDSPQDHPSEANFDDCQLYPQIKLSELTTGYCAEAEEIGISHPGQYNECYSSTHRPPRFEESWQSGIRNYYVDRDEPTNDPPT